MNTTKRKERLKERFGENYLAFMQDLSNISISQTDLCKKWNVSTPSVIKWISELGYSRTASIKMEIRNTYKVQRRVKERQETMKKILSILAK